MKVQMQRESSINKSTIAFCKIIKSGTWLAFFDDSQESRHA